LLFYVFPPTYSCDYDHRVGFWMEDRVFSADTKLRPMTETEYAEKCVLQEDTVHER